MNVRVLVIPHSKQRYNTPGDWWFTRRGNLEIRVSALGDWRMEQLVAIHELTEALQCRNVGITTKQVDAFDIAFEKRRKKGNTDEPGDDPAAPYQFPHSIATGIERIMAAELGVVWKRYEDAILAL